MTTEGAVGARRGSDRGLGQAASWIVGHAVELAFAVVVLVAFVYSLRITRSYYFFADEWLLVKQGGTLSGWFRPYNFQMGVIVIGAYPGTCAPMVPAGSRRTRADHPRRAGIRWRG